jgi:hypothetical protein
MISRRFVMAGLPAAALVYAPVARAVTRCTAPDARGYRQCVTAIERVKMETARQRCNDWCWAACIQAVFSLQGRETAQEWAVEKIFGSSKCQPDGPGGTVDQVVRAINGEWIDQYGFKFQADAQALPNVALIVSTGAPGPGGSWATDTATRMFFDDGAKQLVSELDRGNPLIIGAVGHATVLTAATYIKDSSGYIRLTELIVRDPWGDSPNLRKLTAEEVSGAFFVVRAWVR